MAISLGAVGTPATGTTTLSIVVPAGAVAGQVAVLQVEACTATDVFATASATGWVQVPNGTAKDNSSTTPFPTITVLWRALVAGDPGSSIPLTFTNVPSTCVGVINTYNGADTTSPWDGSQAQQDPNPSSTSHTSATIATTLDTNWILACFGARGVETWTPPSGYSERTDTVSGSNGNLETTDSNGTVAHGSISVTATSSLATSMTVSWIGGLKVVSALDTSPSYATASSDLGDGSGAWVNPGNADGAPDTTYATWTAP